MLGVGHVSGRKKFINSPLNLFVFFRCGVPPFDEAREILNELKPFSKWFESQVKQEAEEESKANQEDVKEGIVKQEDIKESIVKQEDVKQNITKQEDMKESIVKQEDVKESRVKPDLLDLCHILPKEVINLSGGGKGYNVDPDANEEDYAAFRVS